MIIAIEMFKCYLYVSTRGSVRSQRAAELGR
eukprot:SAG31_NODE_31698_length_365_cov_0.778195_2_plen_30_part_01